MKQLSDILADPDLVGESEYRAIYEFLNGVWKDLDDEDNSHTDDQKFAAMVSILAEFQMHAENMRRRIKSEWRKTRLK